MLEIGEKGMSTLDSETNKKECNKCKKRKEYDEFYKKEKYLDSYCIPCRLKINKRWRKKNKKRHRDWNRVYMRKWREKNREAYNAYNRELTKKMKAKKAGEVNSSVE